MLECYKRWRHSRGYGVHSPYAYQIVKQVIRPENGYEWYGYDDIDVDIYINRNGKGLKHVRRHARMLLRLAAWLGVTSAYLPNDHPLIPFHTALKSADSRMRITSAQSDLHNCSLINTSGDFIPLDILCMMLERPGKAIAMRDVPKGWREALFDALPEGVMFHSRKSLIIVHRPDMQKVSYSILL